jgi:type I restriction enzyme S subunit
MEVKKGYKQTEVGVIPEDWQELSVSDVTTKVGSGITPTGGDANYKKHGRPFVRSQNVGWGKLLLDDLAFIDDKLHSTFSSSETCEGDVLLNITGASIGRSAVVDMAVAKGNVNQHVCILRPDQQRCNSKFLNGLLLSPIGQKQIDSFQAGGNRQGLNFSQIRAIRIPLPPTLAEQEAIAGALSDADAWIESLEQLIAKKRQIKQGAMQELLTGKRRLPGFSGRWQEATLGEICTKIQDGTHFSPKLGGSDYLYLTSKNIRFGVLDLSTAERISANEHAKIYSRCDVRKGDLLLTKDGANTGNAAINTLEEPFSLLSSVALVRFDERVFCTRFFLYQLLSKDGQQQIKELMSGNAITRLTLQKIRTIECYYPQIQEQTAIATVLSDMDTEIESLESKLAKAREIKQGMMQELLTGKIRLV